MKKKYEIKTEKLKTREIECFSATYLSNGIESNRHGAAKFEVSVVAGGKVGRDAILSLHHQLQKMREEITNAIGELREKIDL